MFSVVTYPSDGLKQPCSVVSDFGQSLRTTIASMAETMYAEKGVGLAAPQVGLQKRIIVMDHDAGLVDSLRALINPVIIWSSDEKQFSQEGCLSIPGVTVNVERSVEVSVEYRDVMGQTRHTCFTGILARIVQHELDHLDGILMLDRATPMERKMALKNLSKMVEG